jgi:hypothetical protein
MESCLSYWIADSLKKYPFAQKNQHQQNGLRSTLCTWRREKAELAKFNAEKPKLKTDSLYHPIPMIVNRHHGDFVEYPKKLFKGDKGVTIILDQRLQSRHLGPVADFVERRKKDGRK